MSKPKINEQTLRTFSYRFSEAIGDLTQESVAERIGNVSRQMITNYLRGKNMPTVDKLIDISTALGVSTDYLLGLSPIKSPEATVIDASIFLGCDDDLAKSIRKNIRIALGAPVPGSTRLNNIIALHMLFEDIYFLQKLIFPMIEEVVKEDEDKLVKLASLMTDEIRYRTPINPKESFYKVFSEFDDVHVKVKPHLLSSLNKHDLEIATVEQCTLEEFIRKTLDDTDDRTREHFVDTLYEQKWLSDRKKEIIETLTQEDDGHEKD